MRKLTSVAIAAAEAHPFAKTGGLGDVTSALASALATQGMNVCLLLPGYGFIDRQRFSFSKKTEWNDRIRLGDQYYHYSVESGTLPQSDVEVLLVCEKHFFDRKGIYSDPETNVEYPDAALRYAFFSRALLQILRRRGPAPDILHLNDHHTALSLAYLRSEASLQNYFLNTATVFSIHNLGYQGIYSADLATELGLQSEWLEPLGALEFWGRINYMKAGIEFADMITTVSPSYAREIQTPDFGNGLEKNLQARRKDLVGILNGIDTKTWNPKEDAFLEYSFDAADFSAKSQCKESLQTTLGLQKTKKLPIFAIISRLATQKGIDLILEARHELDPLPLQMVFLGRGEPQLERQLQDWSHECPDQVSVTLEFDEALAHQIEAGSDFFVMPSRYEPCGLNQMYSLRYGTIPVVRSTGGLRDTVENWDPTTDTGNGITFDGANKEELLAAMRTALELYKRPRTHESMIRRGMQVDHSWMSAAQSYLKVYDQAQGKKALSCRD